MTVLDWAVFSFYVVLILLVGLYQSRKSTGVEGYFLGNRSLSWGLIGLSVMATQASAITFIGTTGQSYGFGMKFIQVYLPQPLVMVVLCSSPCSSPSSIVGGSTPRTSSWSSASTPGPVP